MRKIATIIGLLGVVGLSWATESRVNAMGGLYPYILDDEALVIHSNPACIFKFTGKSVLELHSQNALHNGAAYGGILFNKGSLALGTYLNTPMYTYTTLDSTERVIHGMTLVLGNTGEGMKWGIRMGVGMDQEADTAYTIKGTYAAIEPGIVLPMGDAKLSIMAVADVAMYSDNSMGEDNVLETTSPLYRGGIKGRYIGAGDMFKWIFGGGVFMTDNGYKVDTVEYPSKTMSGSAFMGFNATPVERVLMVGGLDMAFSKWTGGEDADGNTYNTMNANLNAKFGGELGVNDWAFLRGGIVKSLVSVSNDGSTDTQNPTKRTATGSGLGVYLGSGIVKGPLHFDAVVSEDLLYNGPYFLTGNVSSLVSTLSVLYNFRTE